MFFESSRCSFCGEVNPQPTNFPVQRQSTTQYSGFPVQHSSITPRNGPPVQRSSIVSQSNLPVQHSNPAPRHRKIPEVIIIKDDVNDDMPPPSKPLNQALLVNTDHQSRFSSLPNRAQQELSRSTSQTRREAVERPNADSKAQGFRVKPRTGVFADKFGLAITPYKMYYNLGRNGNKIAKEHVLTGSKSYIQIDMIQ